MLRPDSLSSLSVPMSGVCRNRLLDALPRAEYLHIAAFLKTVPMRHRQVLHKQGEAIDQVYFPGGGACSLTRVMQDGGTAEIVMFGNDGLIGSGVSFGDGISPGDTLVQVEGGEGYAMPVAAFVAEMERSGVFRDRVLRYSQALMSRVMQLAVCNSLHSAEQRCCRWLLMTCDCVMRDDLRLTQEFVASMLGLRRPTVTVVLQDLQLAGFVDLRRGRIRIANRPGLESRCCECYASIKTQFQRLLPEMSDELVRPIPPEGETVAEGDCGRGSLS